MGRLDVSSCRVGDGDIYIPDALILARSARVKELGQDGGMIGSTMCADKETRGAVEEHMYGSMWDAEEGREVVKREPAPVDIKEAVKDALDERSWRLNKPLILSGKIHADIEFEESIEVDLSDGSAAMDISNDDNDYDGE
jgi:hypothetical protein